MRLNSAQLAAWRRRLGLTQTEAGDLLGVSRGAWQQWESGRYLPSPRHLRDLADLLGRPPAAITTTDGPPTLDDLRMWAGLTIAEVTTTLDIGVGTWVRAADGDPTPGWTDELTVMTAQLLDVDVDTVRTTISPTH